MRYSLSRIQWHLCHSKLLIHLHTFATRAFHALEQSVSSRRGWRLSTYKGSSSGSKVCPEGAVCWPSPRGSATDSGYACSAALICVLQIGARNRTQDLKQISNDLQRSQSEFFVAEEAQHNRSVVTSALP